MMPCRWVEHWSSIENLIDNERRENAFGLMMSLNMLIETPEGYDFTLADFEEWTKDAGFSEVYAMSLADPQVRQSPSNINLISGLFCILLQYVTCNM